MKDNPSNDKSSTNPLTLVRKAGEKCGAAYSYIQVDDKKGARSLLLQAKRNIEDALMALECENCGGHPYGCAACRV